MLVCVHRIEYIYLSLHKYNEIKVAALRHMLHAFVHVFSSVIYIL